MFLATLLLIIWIVVFIVNKTMLFHWGWFFLFYPAEVIFYGLFPMTIIHLFGRRFR